MVAAGVLTWFGLVLQVITFVLIVGTIYVLSPWYRKRHTPDPPAPNVVVHTRDDQSIEGVLLSRDTERLRLGNPKMLGEGAERDVPLAGEVWIPIINVRMVQEAR